MKTVKQTLSLILILSMIISCKKEEENKDKSLMVTPEDKLYRPNFHFTPKHSWMNDPNGMFFFNGKYHLYFQYYPKDNIWGPMHWGHAVSKDLVSWAEQPIALYPDDLGYIFSGSAVVDKNNTSGFGKEGKTPIVAIFTYHNAEAEKEGKIDYQTQGIAYSLDEGQTWTKYTNNPVLKNPGIKDFRDPKVVWDQHHQQWLMALATYEKTLFYSSKNLKDWKYLSSFGEDLGNHDGVWECPDFFPLKVENSNETKWVLLQSINPGHINGGSGTQYFVGDFDGERFVIDKTFKNQLKKNKAVWLDYGRDNYAGVTWSNIPEEDGRKLFIGWMSNWEYAQVVPTKTWRSAMTIPKELKLKKFNNEFIITSQPVNEFNQFKTKEIKKENIVFSKDFNLIGSKNIDINKSIVEVELSNLKSDIYTFTLSNNLDENVKFGINNKTLNYFIDRSKSGNLNFSDKFANTVSKANFNHLKAKIKVEIVIDKTSVELFYNDGETVMTEIFFPTEPFENLSISTKNNSETSIEKLIVSQIKTNN